ncbi:MAG: 3-deoxy-7-phosphoheptulonate synthase [Bacillota bacterium]
MNACKLALRREKTHQTIIEVPGPASAPVMIGQGYFTLIAGPCAVENRDDYLELAVRLKNSGLHILRGGAFKPRTSPYSFSGLGIEGLDILAEARSVTGLPVITELMDIRNLDAVCCHADIIQVGSRNMQNYALLKELGRIKMPVMLKRGLSATIEEWLLAAEYILEAGNQRVMLCERGIRTFETATRNTLDINAIPLVKTLSHLPVFVDPSHGSGIRSLVSPVAKAALIAGADGVMVEVHQNPAAALSDGQQSLNPDEFNQLSQELRKITRYEKRVF